MIRLSALEALREQNERETARLEQELIAQKEAKLKAMKQRLEERKRAKVSELMEATGCSEEEALEHATKELEDEEEKEKESIETEAAILLKEGRATAVMDIKEAHERELARVEEELHAQREKKLKAMNDRLSKRKGLRAMELVESGVSAVEAIDIAAAEAADESNKEREKIDAEITADLERQRAELLRPLRELQEKEAKRLDDELAEQESRRRKALQDKLAKKRNQKAAEAASSGKTAKEVEQISQVLEPQDKLEEQKLELELAEMKRIHDEVTARLTEDLTVKKRSANTALQDRLNKRKAKNETKKTPAELMEEYLSTLREEHKSALPVLKHFVDHEKKFAIMEHENNFMRPVSVHLEKDDDDDDDVTDDGGVAAMATLSLTYANLKEGLIAGFKSRCVYEIRAVKDSGQPVALSPSQRAAAWELAATQLIKRSTRDMRSLVEKRRLERGKAVEKLIKDKVRNIRLVFINKYCF